MKNKFEIDFFEFSFLVEACIPQRPIARTMFFHKVIDEYYYELSQDQRDRLFEWINRNPSFQDSLEKGNEDCLYFNARYDRDKQYILHLEFKGESSTKECFLMGGRYYTKRNTSCLEEYVTKIEKKWKKK